jgi:acid stress-induced BolA-like protein IbaG/YrbA
MEKPASIGPMLRFVRTLFIIAFDSPGASMNPEQVADLIQTGLPGSRAMVSSGDNVHFEAVVVADAFAGKRAVQRHQLVYATLGAAVGNEIHALALQVFTPQEFAGRGQG